MFVLCFKSHFEINCAIVFIANSKSKSFYIPLFYMNGDYISNELHLNYMFRKNFILNFSPWIFIFNIPGNC